MLGLAVRDISKIIAWLCVRDDSLKAAQICFVTGPRIELDIELIKRRSAYLLGNLDIYSIPRKQSSNSMASSHAFLNICLIPFDRRYVQMVDIRPRKF
jgi:hypothetical protein